MTFFASLLYYSSALLPLYLPLPLIWMYQGQLELGISVSLILLAHLMMAYYIVHTGYQKLGIMTVFTQFTLEHKYQFPYGTATFIWTCIISYASLHFPDLPFYMLPFLFLCSVLSYKRISYTCVIPLQGMYMYKVRTPRGETCNIISNSSSWIDTNPLKEKRYRLKMFDNQLLQMVD